MKRIMALLLALLLLPAAVLAEDGAQEEYLSYEQFIGRYAGNLEFINEMENRHLISLIFSSADNDGDFRVFRLAGDVVSAKMRTKGSGRTVVMLQVNLVAPENLQPNTTAYADFVTSGYHCYALLMAMASGDEPAERWPLVEELNRGLSGAHEYRTSAGPYNLTARRAEDGRSVSFTFSSLYWDDPLDFIEMPEPNEPESPAGDDGELPATHEDDLPEEDASDVG